jgi:hypothetical protein
MIRPSSAHHHPQSARLIVPARLRIGAPESRLRQPRSLIMLQPLLRTGVALALVAGAAAADAAVINFTGTVTGVSTLVGLDSACAPLQFRSLINPASTVGYSTLGNFTLSTNTCLAPAGPNAPSFGTFTIDFGADSFNGTFNGGSNPSSTPGIADTAWAYTILGGTGRFEGALGILQAAGLADARTRPTHVAISFMGDINAPAVPEPASWALMILGFSGIGLALRSGRRQVLSQVA